MPKAVPPLELPIPPEVGAFAAEQGVEAEIPVVVEMTRGVFPGADLSLALDEDPEIADDRHIVILAKNVDLSADQAVASRWEWHRGLFKSCPAPLVWVFRLGLELKR